MTDSFQDVDRCLRRFVRCSRVIARACRLNPQSRDEDRSSRFRLLLQAGTLRASPPSPDTRLTLTEPPTPLPLFACPISRLALKTHFVGDARQGYRRREAGDVWRRLLGAASLFERRMLPSATVSTSRTDEGPFAGGPKPLVDRTVFLFF